MKKMSNIPKYGILSLNMVIHLFIFVPTTYFIGFLLLDVILHPPKIRK